MATFYTVSDSELTAVADSIRSKSGASDKLKWPDGFVSEIGNIKTSSSSVVIKNPIDSAINTFESERSDIKNYITEAKSRYSADTGYTTSVVGNYTGASGLDIPTGLPIVPTQNGYLYLFREDTGRANERVAVTAGTTSYIYNLIPNVTYTYLLTDSSGAIYKGGRIKDQSTLRELNCQNGRNFRDIGGWSVGSGRVIKYGLIIRGSQIENNNGVQITDENKIRFRDLGILEDVDLRSLSEINKGTTDTSDDISSNAAGAYINYVRYEMSNYLDAVNLSGNAYTTTVTVLKRIMSNAVRGIPTYVHCAGGMDRTGTICILLEALLGMSEVDIEIDYELSSFVESRTRDKIKETMAYLKTFAGSKLQDQVVSWANSAGVTTAEIAAYQTAMTGANSTSTKNTVKITRQPVDITTDGSTNVIDWVDATGDGLTYLWEYRAGSTGTWSSLSTLGLPATDKEFILDKEVITSAVDGWQIRCIVTDQYGNTETSRIATMTYKATATYTNLAGTVTDGYSLSSSGAPEQYSGKCLSDYIAIPDGKTTGHRWHIGGRNITWASTEPYNRISFYDSTKAHLKTIAANRFNSDDYWPTSETPTDQSSTIIANLDRQIPSAAYLRIAATGAASNLIITCDEDIT